MGNAFNDEAVLRLGLLRRLLPDREEFSSQGYGHLLWDNFLHADDTIKTGIAREHLPLIWLTMINGTFRGVADLRFRPATWPEYAQQVHRIRWAVVDSLKQLERGIQAYFRRRNVTKVLGGEINEEAWNSCKKALNRPPRLPLVAVDEWGFVDESTSDANARGPAEQLKKRSGLAVQRYKSFLKPLNKHIDSLGNFFMLASQGMTITPYLGRAADRRKVLEAAVSLGVKPESAKLATIHLVDAVKNLAGFQRASRKVLGPFFDGRELDRLDDEEQKIFRRVWSLWYVFAFHPERVMQNAAEACVREPRRVLRDIRLDLRARLRRMSSDDLRFSIASEELLWEEEPALWLTADARHLLDATASLPILLGEIGQAVRKVKNNQLRHYTLDLHWPYVVIVPLVRGRNAGTVAWRISMPNIVGSVDQELRWWDYAQQQIPPDALRQLNIDSWDLPELAVATKLVQSTAVLFYVAAHIRDFRRLPDLDEEGMAQLQTYVDRLTQHGSEALQSVLDAETEMIEVCNNLPEGALSRRPSLLEAGLEITKLHDIILPSADFDSSVALNLEELTVWASRLELAPLQALAISSAWTSDVLDQIGA